MVTRGRDVDARPLETLRLEIVADIARRAEEEFGGDRVAVVPAETGPEPPEPAAGCRLVRVGSVVGPAGAATAHDVVELVGDPCVLRLALMRFRPDETAVLSLARCRRAEATLRRWRSKMAGWHDLPASRAPAAVMSRVRTALAALDTHRALVLLHGLETDPRVPSGGKYAAFAAADRVLALDLERLVGKLPR